MPDNVNGTPGDAGTQTPGDAGTKGTQTPKAATFDSLYESLDDGQKGLIDSHVHGLKSTLDKFKGENKELKLAVQVVKDATGKELAEVQSNLTKQLEESERNTRFLESCPATIKDRKAAKALAREYGAIRSDGTLDADRLKESFPQIFETTTPAPRPGATQGGTPGPADINDKFRNIIRR